MNNRFKFRDAVGKLEEAKAEDDNYYFDSICLCIFFQLTISIEILVCRWSSSQLGECVKGLFILFSDEIMGQIKTMQKNNRNTIGSARTASIRCDQLNGSDYNKLKFIQSERRSACANWNKCEWEKCVVSFRG